MNPAEPVPVSPPDPAPTTPEAGAAPEPPAPPFNWLDKGLLPINYGVVGASPFGWLFGKP